MHKIGHLFNGLSFLLFQYAPLTNSQLVHQQAALVAATTGQAAAGAGAGGTYISPMTAATAGQLSASAAQAAAAQAQAAAAQIAPALNGLTSVTPTSGKQKNIVQLNR